MPPPNNLPLRRTQLIGREQEVSAIQQFLLPDEARLLTLTGPAGIGKTRLALQVGAELLDKAGTEAFPFDDGIFFIPLDPIRDPLLVPRAIAQTLDVHEAADYPVADTLREHLRDKRLLLILDNFEQVTTAATFLSELLGAAAHLKLLVTSREVLHIYAEQDFPVPPLSLPPVEVHGRAPLQPERLADYAAVRLFVERAASVKPNFAITADNSSTVAQICRRLDGLPLAIELAAARIRILPPQAMLDRLQSRLNLLTGGARNLPARQQTLRDSIAWSYDLLDENEQTLFRRLSVFVGGCTLEAIEAILDFGFSILDLPKSEPDVTIQNLKSKIQNTLDIVESLLNKSLLRQEETAEGEPRFSMLPTIHEYALEQLQQSGKAEQIQQRYAAYYVQLAETAEPELIGAGQAEWLDTLEADHDNLQEVLRWAETGGGDIETGLRMAGALLHFWDLRGYLAEGQEHALALVARADTEHIAPTVAYAKALNVAAVLAYRQSDIAAARQLHERGLAVSRQIGDPLRIARSLNGLAHVNRVEGDLAAARALLEEALVISRDLGNKWNLAAVLTNLGLTTAHDQDKTAALEYYREALVLIRELGDKGFVATTLGYMGFLARRQHDYEQSRALFEEALSVHQELGDKHGIATALGVLGELAFLRGDYAAVAPLQEESLAVATEIGDKWSVGTTLVNLGQLARLQGDNAKAAQYLAEALSIWQDLDQMHGAAGTLSETAALFTDLGNTQDAARLIGAVEGVVKTTGKQLVDKELIDHLHNMDYVRSRLDKPTFSKLMSEGESLSLAQTIEIALPPLQYLMSLPEEPRQAAPEPAAQKSLGETPPADLTEREIEVLRLLVSGKSNPQIAAELYLSINTVQAHLRSVYSKIGVASRAEATRYALEHNLAG